MRTDCLSLTGRSLISILIGLIRNIRIGLVLIMIFWRFVVPNIVRRGHIIVPKWLVIRVIQIRLGVDMCFTMGKWLG